MIQTGAPLFQSFSWQMAIEKGGRHNHQSEDLDSSLTCSVALGGDSGVKIMGVSLHPNSRLCGGIYDDPVNLDGFRDRF